MAIVEGYATLPEVKADLRLTTTKDDERLERCIEAASRLIDHITHRKWSAAAVEARTFTPPILSPYVWIDECETVTLVEESNDLDTWSTVTSWVPNPSGPVGRLKRLSGGTWMEYVRVTATFDGAAYPPNINQACRIEAVRLFKRPDTPEGVLVGDFGAATMARIDPDFLALVRASKRRVLG